MACSNDQEKKTVYTGNTSSDPDLPNLVSVFALMQRFPSTLKMDRLGFFTFFPFSHPHLLRALLSLQVQLSDSSVNKWSQRGEKVLR